MGDFGTFMDKPWGGYINHAGGEGWHLKTLRMNPGTRLSLQKHGKREEAWILVDGDATATIGETLDSLRDIPLERLAPKYVIPIGMIHRICTESGCTIIEIMNGHYDEEDIERFEDDFGRA